MAMEFKPCLYLIFTFLWINRFGVPSADDFIRVGTYLSAIAAAEFVVLSIVAQSPVRPALSGETNYEACLLLLSFVIAINNSTKWRKQLFIIGAGLLLTFSRTAQATAVLLAIVAGGLGLVAKVSIALAALVGVAISFQVRSLSTDVGGGDRFFMWSVASRMFAQDPLGFLVGYQLGVPLDAEVPKQLAALWHSQSTAIGVGGVYAFNFHSMWIRLIMSWGMMTVIPLVAMLLFWSIRNRSKLVISVIIIIFIEGMTMGVFYLSNVAVPLLMFMCLAERLAKIKPGSQATHEAFQ
jgi:hypothetical protein